MIYCIHLWELEDLPEVSVALVFSVAAGQFWQGLDRLHLQGLISGKPAVNGQEQENSKQIIYRVAHMFVDLTVWVGSLLIGQTEGAGQACVCAVRRGHNPDTVF